MPLNFGRAKGVAAVSVDEARCTGCGACETVCEGGPLYLENGRPRVDQTRLFGCVGCGGCVAACPPGAVSVSGRDLFPEDVLPLPGPGERASYDQLLATMLARRSVRSFTDRPVEPEVVDRILAAASTSPMGLTPSEVGVLVLNGREKVRDLAVDLSTRVRKYRWLLSAPALALMRPFVGEENFLAFRDFIAPAMHAYEGAAKRGRDWFLYDAPLALAFYGSAFADPADPLVPATYAMLAGEALGLGTCMLGLPMFILKYSDDLKRKYGLPKKMQPGIVVVFGYPAVRFHRSLRRRLAEVRCY